MRAILSFNLPDEREEFELAQRAGKAEIVIEDLFNMIRSRLKYENQTQIDLEELRAFLVNKCEEWNLPL